MQGIRPGIFRTWQWIFEFYKWIGNSWLALFALPVRIGSPYCALLVYTSCVEARTEGIHSDHSPTPSIINMMLGHYHSKFCLTKCFIACLCSTALNRWESLYCYLRHIVFVTAQDAMLCCCIRYREESESLCCRIFLLITLGLWALIEIPEHFV
jgi:hypothetical protein